MPPSLSCDSNMTAWLNDKSKGSGVSEEEEEDLVLRTKATDDTKDQ